jgi:hypothetical protein
MRVQRNLMTLNGVADSRGVDLKILFPATGVRAQVPPRAPIISTICRIDRTGASRRNLSCRERQANGKRSMLPWWAVLLPWFTMGVTTMDHQEIEGITGGALDAKEGEPGPSTFRATTMVA